ncbi:MAG: GNAT family N-acetyltransferase [Gammaproteobacteria bacterium]|nr:GNAT family N-acetyltransferase [Gammaproteobacteria bacterium]
MLFREANYKDASAIANLHADSWRVAYRGIFRDENLDGDVVNERKEVWNHRLSAPKDNQLVILAEENSELCGFVCAYGNEDPTWGTFIDNLHVRKERKRKGIGRGLMKEIALWSRRHYPDAGLYLGVLERNLSARRFYEALGARNQESRLWEPPGGGEVVDLRYVWSNLDSIIAGNG